MWCSRGARWWWYACVGNTPLTNKGFLGKLFWAFRESEREKLACSFRQTAAETHRIGQRMSCDVFITWSVQQDGYVLPILKKGGHLLTCFNATASISTTMILTAPRTPLARTSHPYTSTMAVSPCRLCTTQLKKYQQRERGAGTDNSKTSGRAENQRPRETKWPSPRT
jgi:hypothetical protein